MVSHGCKHCGQGQLYLWVVWLLVGCTTITPTHTPAPTLTVMRGTPNPTFTSAALPTPFPSPTPEAPLSNLSTATLVIAAPTPTTVANTIILPTTIPVQIKQIASPGYTLAFSPDDRLLAIGGQNEVQVWETATWQLQWQAPFQDFVRKVIFSPNGERLAAASFDGTAKLWVASTGKLITEFTHDYWVYGLDFSGDSQWVASGALVAHDLMIAAHASTGEIIGRYDNALPVADLALAPKGPWLAAMTAGSWGPMELVVWDIFTHERRSLRRFDGLNNHSNVIFSPDTQWLAAWMGAGEPIRIWETKLWLERFHLEIPMGFISQLRFSPDGQRLAALLDGVNEGDWQVVIWETSGWTRLAVLQLPDVAWQIAFSPNGRTLATALGQGGPQPAVYAGLLWDVDQGQARTLMPHAQQVQAVAFSHQGQWVATGSVDGTVAIWQVQSP